MKNEVILTIKIFEMTDGKYKVMFYNYYGDTVGEIFALTLHDALEYIKLCKGSQIAC